MKEIDLENLNNLIEEIEAKSKARSLSDEYLKEHNCPTRDNVGISEYVYGIIMIPEDFVLPYLKELRRIWVYRKI